MGPLPLIQLRSSRTSPTVNPSLSHTTTPVHHFSGHQSDLAYTRISQPLKIPWHSSRPFEPRRIKVTRSFDTSGNTHPVTVSHQRKPESSTTPPHKPENSQTTVLLLHATLGHRRRQWGGGRYHNRIYKRRSINKVPKVIKLNEQSLHRYM